MKYPTGIFSQRCCLWAVAFIFLAGTAAMPAFAAQAPVRTPAATQANAGADTETAKLLALREAAKADATPVSVEHRGTDTLGAKLALGLKEVFNTGTLFALNDDDAPKVLILISTEPEFASRPAVGSVYSVIWLYSERSSVLSNYLAHEVGVITRENLGDLVEQLASRSSGLAAKHAYIFRK